MEIVNKMASDMGLFFVAEKGTTPSAEADSPSKGGEFAPIDILDYIYAVLHSPKYREKYKEFLKIDFPRVPYPKDQKTFFDLVELGSQLREIHLLESPVVTKYITQYPEDGDNVVTKPRFENSPMEPPCPVGQTTHPKEEPPRPLGTPPKEGKIGHVYINDTQYFANVPEVAWNFYIGGYQPAQKWLKDRKGRELSYEDILHYQKIIVALTKTEGIMGEIDGVSEV
jgi:predicted helicase